MAENEDVKVYKCTNFGACTKADSGEEIKIPTIETIGGTPPCPHCHQNTLEEQIKKGFPAKIVGIIAAGVLAVAGAGYGIWSLVGGSSDPLDKIAKIELSKEKITLLVGGKPKTVKATAVDKDGKEIKNAKLTYQWTIDNNDIATVTQEGEIAAVKEGDAIVTVTVDGQKQGISATCEVKVKKGPEGIMIKNISITDAKDFTLKKGGTKKLEYKAEPTDHNETVAWESSDPSVATVDANNGLVTAVKRGSAKITAKAMKVSSEPVTVTVVEDNGPEPPGPLNLGYGIYEGPIKNGKANGIGGTIRFTRSYSIDLKKASGETVEVNSGDKLVNVKMENNRIIQGQLKRTDGSQRWIIIG